MASRKLARVQADGVSEPRARGRRVLGKAMLGLRRVGVGPRVSGATVHGVVTTAEDTVMLGLLPTEAEARNTAPGERRNGVGKVKVTNVGQMRGPKCGTRTGVGRVKAKAKINGPRSGRHCGSGIGARRAKAKTDGLKNGLHCGLKAKTDGLKNGLHCGIKIVAAGRVKA